MDRDLGLDVEIFDFFILKIKFGLFIQKLVFRVLLENFESIESVGKKLTTFENYQKSFNLLFNELI